MALQLFGFPGFPHDLAVSKTITSPKDCAFFLDFQRPLVRLRWFGVSNSNFGVFNSWIGRTISMLVPVAHISEQIGVFVFALHRGEPYFEDIQKFWAEHDGQQRGMAMPAIGGLALVASFAINFPDDAKPPATE